MSSMESPIKRTESATFPPVPASLTPQRTQHPSKPEIYQIAPRTIQLHDTDCGLACIHTMVGFYLDREDMQERDDEDMRENDQNDALQRDLEDSMNDEAQGNEANMDIETSQPTTKRTLHPLPQSLLPYHPTFLPSHLPPHLLSHQLQYLTRINHLIAFQTELLHRKSLKASPQELMLVWTIDYAYYISHNITPNFLFCTQQIGVDPQYENLEFYADVIQDDFIRVNRLFDEAKADGIPIRKVHLSLEVLKRLIHREHMYAIIVVDSNRMKCLSCEYVPSESDEEEDGEDGDSSSSSSDESWEEVPTDPDTATDVDDKDFSGHFILLVDSNDVQIFYKDSSTHSCTTCVCDAQRLDRARLAFGTDEDILLVCMDPNVNLEKILQKELKREAREMATQEKEETERQEQQEMQVTRSEEPEMQQS